jgi:tRNA 5-methylaminomethyl-2-thiouridine biosynthesis bifunctional protein
MSLSSPLTERPLDPDAGEHARPLPQDDRRASHADTLAQARHVFLRGNHLPERWAGRDQFVVLETGFGVGNRFLATWAAWKNNPQRPQRLHVVSIENHPIRRQDLTALLTRVDEVHHLREQLVDQWPQPLAGMHRLSFESNQVILTLVFGDVTDALTALSAGIDAFYLGGFSPDHHPDWCKPAVYQGLARLARPHATLATDSSATQVHDGLEEAGFQLERVSSDSAGKYHRVRGHQVPGKRRQRRHPPMPRTEQRDAMVVGAGLAGASCALALAQRGWQVTVLEQGHHAASGASGLPSGLLHPWLSRDDNTTARLSRAGFLHALRLLNQLDGSDTPAANRVHVQTGVLHLSESLDEFADLSHLLQRQQWPADWAKAVLAEHGKALTGVECSRPGIWFSQGAVVSPARWCRVMLNASPRISLHTGIGVAAIQEHADRVDLILNDGSVRQTSLVIVASASTLCDLLPLTDTLTTKLPGRVSLLEPQALTDLKAGISGDGYVIPGLIGNAAVGGTYETPDTPPDDPEQTHRAHQQNLDRLHTMLGTHVQATIIGQFHGVRCTPRDRQPLAGRWPDPAQAPDLARHGAHLPDLPRRQRVAGLGALGSRGMTVAPILAELLASQLEGEPCPLPQDLIQSVDPARFALRRWRQMANSDPPLR